MDFIYTSKSNFGISKLTFNRTLIYLLFLFSGIFKPFLHYYGFFLDITLIFGSILVLDLLFSSRQKSITSFSLVVISMVLIFYLWLLLSLSYTESPFSSYKKTYLFILNIIAVVYPILFKKKIKLDYLLKKISYLSLPLGIWFIVLKKLRFSTYNHLVDTISFDPISKNYLGFGAISGIAIVYFFYSRKYILFIISILITLSLGARGVLVFSLIATAPIFFGRINKIKLKVNYKYLMIFPFLLSILLLFWHKIYYFAQFGMSRFTTLFDIAKDNSNAGRVEHYIFAIEHIFSSSWVFIFGEGIGSYGLIHSGKDIISYPHNVLLEIWFELGLVGLVLFSSSFIIVSLKKNSLIIKLIFLFFILNALKSQHLSELRILYGMMGMALIPNKEHINEQLL